MTIFYKIKVINYFNKIIIAKINIQEIKVKPYANKLQIIEVLIFNK